MSEINVRKESLEELQQSFLSCSSSLSELHASIDSYIGRIIDEAQSIVNQYEQKKIEAEKVYDAAQRAYDDCVSRQRWDSEEECNKPSCSMESIKKHYAEANLRKAEALLKMATEELNKINNASTDYNATGGAGAIIRNVSGDKTTDAVNRLQHFIEIVETHEDVETSIKSSAGGLNNKSSNNRDAGNGSLNTMNKADKFNAGTEKVKEKIKSEDAKRIYLMKKAADGGSDSSLVRDGGVEQPDTKVNNIMNKAAKSKAGTEAVKEKQSAILKAWLLLKQNER